MRLRVTRDLRIAIRSRSAFSLIEILISIVVLSLGLLGLAAVFPAVVRQQRIASDSIQGTSIERSVEEYIKSSSVLNAANPGLSASTGEDDRFGWQMLSANPAWSDQATWVLSEPSIVGLPGTGIDPVTGTMTMGLGDNQAYIPMTERLIPTPYSSTSDPRFVWDFVTRRVVTGSAATAFDDSVQVAVFVRRIDAGIRRTDRPLSDLFSGSGGPLAPSARRVPVAADDDGRPTSDGLGVGDSRNYSQILRLPFTTYPANPDGREAISAITFDRDTEGLYKFASQIGQKLIDQAGVVHEVIGFVRENDEPTGAVLALRISPPLSPAIVQLAEDDEIYSTVIFTPQVPASVNVFTVTPGSTQ